MDKETGKIHGLNRALMADAVGTTVGALCGTSTVTTYVESTTGIAAGGRTGLTAFTVAMLFLVALFFSPLFLVIPSAATTSALVIVGVLMTKTITHINFSDFTESVPAFITIIAAEGALGVTDLVELTGNANSTTYNTLRKLEEAGLVEKTAGQKRVLTELGRQLVSSL